MPSFDVEAMRAEDAFNDEYKIGPWRFGKNFETNFNLDNSGIWHTMPNGDKVWRLGIESDGALSINFEFSTYEIPDGAEVFVYNSDRSQFIGAFTNKNNAGHGELGVQQVAGQSIIIEYTEPANAAFPGRLTIGQVTHAYRDIMGFAKGLGDSGSCNNNVICPEGDPWDNEIRSVAMIVVGGNGACTGTLLNSCAQDGTPYFLTANHCLGGSNTWVFRFNWDSPSCNQNLNGPTNQTVSGSSLLANNGASDFALLQLNSTPPSNYNVYYAGWDATGTPPNSSTGIHHPSGDVKKISFDTDASSTANFQGVASWHISDWEDGTTEGGSSGSGLWNENHHIIGQLYGGIASCQNNVDDYYGRFDLSYPQMEQWLGNCTQILDGWDPNLGSLDLDASLQSINDVPASLCNESSVSPTVTLKNNGNITLTSADIVWEFNGGGTNTINWTGNLTTGQTDVIALPTLNGNNGNNTLEVYCDNPNGGMDENTNNDNKSTNFSVANPGGMVTFTLVIDFYGSETTWELQDAQSNVLESGGPYSDFANGETHEYEWCLPDGCYDLVIFDSYGDGICCDYGDGSYSVVDQFGTEVASGGQFTDQVTENFCVIVSDVEEWLSNNFNLYPNPSAGVLNLSFTNEVREAQVRVLNALGAEVQNQQFSDVAGSVQQLDLRPQAEGIYLVEITVDGQKAVKRVALER